MKENEKNVPATMPLLTANEGGRPSTAQAPMWPLESRRRTLILLALPFTSVALILLPAFLLRLSPEIELSVKVDQLTFTVDHWESMGIFSGLEANRIQILGFKELAVPFKRIDIYQATTDTWRRIVARQSSIRGVTPFSFVDAEGARIHSSPSSPGTEITLRWQPEEKNRISIRTKPGDSQAAFPLTVDLVSAPVVCSGCAIGDLSDVSLRVTTQPNQRVSVSPRGDFLQFNIWGSIGSKLTEMNIPLKEGSDIALIRAEAGQRVSSIIDENGKLVIESTGKTILIPDGSYVEIGSLSNAIIRRLEIDNGIKLTLRGRTESLRFGATSEIHSDQRPSWLEVAAASNELATYWAAVVVLGTALLSVLTRLKFVTKE